MYNIAKYKVKEAVPPIASWAIAHIGNAVIKYAGIQVVIKASMKRGV